MNADAESCRAVGVLFVPLVVESLGADPDLQQQTLSAAAISPGHALWVGEMRKMNADAESCRAVGVLFVPLVVESLGGWSDEAIRTITNIGRFLGQRLGIPPPESTRHLFQRLAISLWRRNAALWIRRQLALPDEEDGII